MRSFVRNHIGWPTAIGIIVVTLLFATFAIGQGIDDAAYGVATSRVSPVGCLFDDTSPDSVDEGDIGTPRMSANRNQYQTIRDAAGNERGVNVTASNEMNVLESNSAAIKTALEIIDDWDSSDRADVNVNLNAGVAVDIGAGNVSTGTARFTLAADDPAVVDLAALEVDLAAIEVLQTSIEGDTTAIQTAVEIMDDWDETNRAAVNLIASQVGVAGGSGVNGATVQRVTIATDDEVNDDVDAIKTAVEIMDDWDNGGDQANIDIAAVSVTALPVSDDSSANAEGNPMYFERVAPVLDADDTAACLAIPAAEADYTVTHDQTQICASGNTVYILCANSAPVTADHTVGNFSIVVPDGMCLGPYDFTGLTVCSYIGVAAAGFVCFLGSDYN